MRIVVVDDLRSFPDLDATYARTSGQAVVLLEELARCGAGLDQLWLDHDLGTLNDGTLDDIGPVVDWLCEQAFFDRALPIAQVVIHTSNPVGAEMTESALSRFYATRRVDALSAGAITSQGQCHD